MSKDVQRMTMDEYRGCCFSTLETVVEFREDFIHQPRRSKVENNGIWFRTALFSSGFHDKCSIGIAGSTSDRYDSVILCLTKRKLDVFSLCAKF